MNQTILLLEDDVQFSNTIKQFLISKDYNVICAYDGLCAEEMMYEKEIDLMLLDVKVPYQNGFECLKKLRNDGCEVPAIFITALNTTENVSEGFKMGCDDYIRKPFALNELLVRIESLLRRRYGIYSDHFDLGDGYVFDVKKKTLKFYEENIVLRKKELNLLAIFVVHCNELLTYDKISNAIWKYEETPSVGSLRTHVKTLRAIIGKEKIVTIKNIGYRFVKK